MKTWIFIHLLLVAAFMQAQTYSSLKLEEIGNEINKDCFPMEDSIFRCPEVIKGKSLIITYNQKQEVNHLGISLFSEETKRLINFPVCNFIERLMLELVLEKTIDDTKQTLDRYKIKLMKNGVAFGGFNFTSLSDVLAEIRNPVKFSLQKNQDQFAAFWEFNDDNQFVVSFPATRDLIFGTDKKESDELLSNQLFEERNPCGNEDNLTPDDVSEKDLLYDPTKNIFTKKGREFTLQFINSNTYYKKADDSFELLFSEDFPGESISNLIIKDMGNLNHHLHIVHRMYGHFSPAFDIPLHKFLCFFRGDYDIFTAVSFTDPKELKLTVILNNKDYNYVHLLLINTPTENIFKNEGVLNANFYSNIPQQSIKSLIDDVKQR